MWKYKEYLWEWRLSGYVIWWGGMLYLDMRIFVMYKVGSSLLYKVGLSQEKLATKIYHTYLIHHILMKS